MPSRILVVDDEPNIVASVFELLARAGYDVITALTARAALQAIAQQRPDVMVLDLGLPDMDGVEVCRLVREDHTLPIIVLSARVGEPDKVHALDAGADDYMTKPFGGAELLARLRVALRRAAMVMPATGQVRCADLVVDRDRNRVWRGDEEIRLTPRELELLLVLARSPGRVLTHRAILKTIWGPHAAHQPEHLRVLVAALRKKIEVNPSKPKYIVTEPWVGYRFVDTAPDAAAGSGD